MDYFLQKHTNYYVIGGWRSVIAPTKIIAIFLFFDRLSKCPPDTCIFDGFDPGRNSKTRDTPMGYPWFWCRKAIQIRTIVTERKCPMRDSVRNALPPDAIWCGQQDSGLHA